MKGQVINSDNAILPYMSRTQSRDRKREGEVRDQKGRKERDERREKSGTRRKRKKMKGIEWRERRANETRLECKQGARRENV